MNKSGNSRVSAGWMEGGNVKCTKLHNSRHDNDGDDDAKDKGDPAGPLDHDDDERYGRSKHAAEPRRRADERVQSGLDIPRLGEKLAEAEPQGSAAAGSEEYARHEDAAGNRRAVRGDHHDEVKPAARA